MCAQYVEYKPKRILNVYKHCDGGWYWNKYSANPYVGCEYGCEYCYLMTRKYTPYENPKDFCRLIKVKVNAPELLRKELAKVPRDIIVIGFYQLIETKYGLIRELLETCLELGFPVHMNEKSDLILRDLDVLKRIDERSWACVTFSITSTRRGLRIFEPKAPSVEKRLKAMEGISEAGILTGTALIPVLPFIYDVEENVREVIRATSEHGGKYVLGGALTLGGPLSQHYLALLEKHYPALVERTGALYIGDGYSPDPAYSAEIGKMVKRYCDEHGLLDRIPRPTSFYPRPVQTNRRIAGFLYDQVYRLELECAPKYKVWAYRKAAWALDDFELDIDDVYRREGEEGLRAISGIGKSISTRITEELERRPG